VEPPPSFEPYFQPNGKIPAGWYPDPSREFDWRWWDGTQWTEWGAYPRSAGRQPLVTSRIGKAALVALVLVVLGSITVFGLSGSPPPKTPPTPPTTVGGLIVAPF
jgi:hypothetical protein